MPDTSTLTEKEKREKFLEKERARGKKRWAKRVATETAEDREKRLAHRRELYWKNRDQYLASMHKWRKENKERHDHTNALWREKNREKIRLNQIEWRKTQDPEKVKKQAKFYKSKDGVKEKYKKQRKEKYIKDNAQRIKEGKPTICQERYRKNRVKYQKQADDYKRRNYDKVMLSDAYINRMLVGKSKILKKLKYKFPKEMIKLKREHLKLKRKTDPVLIKVHRERIKKWQMSS